MTSARGIAVWKHVQQACTTQKARSAKLINIYLSRAAKSISFRCSLEEILELQLIIIQSQAFATFSAI